MFINGGKHLLIWSVANQKGGVGKTTSAVTLGGLAAARGMRVLLIDLDPHGSLTSYFGFSADAPPSSSLPLFHEPQTLSRARLLKGIEKTSTYNLSLMLSSTALATLERQAATREGMGLKLKRNLTELKNDFDLVIIDCPPLLGVLMVNALAAASRLIVPVQTEHLAIKGLDRMLHTLSMLNRSKAEPLPYLIVPTLFDRRTQASVTSLRTLRCDYHSHPVWPSMIPVDTRLRDASRLGRLPHELDAQTRGVESYSALLQYMLDLNQQDRSAQPRADSSTQAQDNRLPPQNTTPAPVASSTSLDNSGAKAFVREKVLGNDALMKGAVNV